MSTKVQYLSAKLNDFEHFLDFRQYFVLDPHPLPDPPTDLKVASLWLRATVPPCRPNQHPVCLWFYKNFYTFCRWSNSDLEFWLQCLLFTYISLQTCLLVGLFTDGPISNPTSCTQNAGAQRRCGVQVPRGAVWLDSAVRLDTSLQLWVAVSCGRLKWCPSDALLPLTLFLAYFHHQRSTDIKKWFLKKSRHIANFRLTLSLTQSHFPTPANIFKNMNYQMINDFF